MMYFNLILALIFLFISYVIRIFLGLNYRTFSTHRIPILCNSITQLIATIIWIGLLLWAGYLLYNVTPIALFVGLLLYCLVFDFFFVKRFIRYFGGDLAFPDNLRRCENIINAMMSAYVRIKKAKDINEKELLLGVFKSRYPFMKSKKRKEIVEKCKNIKELIYEVLKIDFIDFDVQKSEPIKEQIDKIIDIKLKENDFGK